MAPPPTWKKTVARGPASTNNREFLCLQRFVKRFTRELDPPRQDPQLRHAAGSRHKVLTSHAGRRPPWPGVLFSGDGVRREPGGDGVCTSRPPPVSELVQVHEDGVRIRGLEQHRAQSVSAFDRTAIRRSMPAMPGTVRT